MTENAENGTNLEYIYFLKILMIFIVKKINMQHFLFLTAFLIFGVGDGITAAFMMEIRGAWIEANPIYSFLFTTQGFYGFILTKIWLTFVMLLAIYIVQLRASSNIYWTVNGFLIALIAGGLMAVNANLTAIAGKISQSPDTIILSYLVLMVVLIEAGSFLDEHYQKIKQARVCTT
jgi:hypothetical protein